MQSEGRRVIVLCTLDILALTSHARLGQRRRTLAAGGGAFAREALELAAYWRGSRMSCMKYPALSVLTASPAKSMRIRLRSGVMLTVMN